MSACAEYNCTMIYLVLTLFILACSPRLDARGGPNHLGNLCDAPILAVPHRVKKAPKAVRNQPKDMEPTEEDEVPIVGETRTKEELNAMGNPAEFLDVGLVVQPMYYYMGHISRHVRPGARAKPALVDSSATDSTASAFRPVGQTVPGGGLNDLERVRSIVQRELGWSNKRWKEEAEAYQKIWKGYYSLV